MIVDNYISFFEKIFPYSCYLCKKIYHQPICDRCKKIIILNLKISNRNFPYVDKVFRLCLYEESIKTIIHEIKFNHQKYLAKFFSSLISSYLEKFISDFDVIIPIPTHEKRKRLRGFDHLSLLFYETLKFNKKKFEDNFVHRIKNTNFLHGLNSKERKKELKGAFTLQLNKEINYKNKKILIVDDILTSGQTITNVATLLKTQNPKKLIFLTIAEVL